MESVWTMEPQLMEKQSSSSAELGEPPPPLPLPPQHHLVPTARWSEAP